ncbi:TonB-dependent siderophore receptor [Aquitalea denitrificans]|uniref:TonB-dependent siderophore receptor n=1 Tax=Aquitalea denitrificans TaxID=519081 RepID=UPI00196B6482|nr:TonB-dependent siderophore receptor [Aquitalea denitrificans]
MQVHRPAAAHAPFTSGFTLRPLCLAVMLAATGVASQAYADDAATVAAGQPADVAVLPAVTVSAEAPSAQLPTEKQDTYTIKHSDSATRLNLSPRETPQAVSVVTHAKMEDFNLNTINDVLANTTGVTVEKVETNRTYYTARGFDITNFQMDGIGVPMTYSLQYGDIDTAMFDRIEIVRGANGLSSSTGNPSATVNFIRKRPTDDFQASAGLTIGSWDTKRLDVDVSGPLNQEGTVTGRVVAAHEDGHSYLDRYKPSRDVFYGVLENKLSDKTVLTLGYSYQKEDGKGAMWGALPMSYSDGSSTNYPVGTSTATDWSYMDTTEQRVFAELAHALDNGWQWKSTLGYNQFDTDSALFYVYGTPNKTTGGGLYAYPSRYESSNKQVYFDSNLGGKYTLAERQHDFNLGVNLSRSRLTDVSHYGAGIGTELFGSTAFNGSYAMPSFDASVDGSSYVDTRKTLYAATRLNLADPLKLLLGANYTQASSSGYSYGVGHALDQSATSPYVGLVVDLTEQISAYGSVAKIFNPQTQTDASGATLAAARGTGKEIGLKGEFFQRRLNTSLSLFEVQQDNIAEQAGYVGSKAYYRGISAKSKGVEFDVSGELAHNWQASLGVVAQQITGENGDDVRLYVPRRQVRLSTTWRVPQLEQLKLGASLNYQSETRYSSTSAAYQGGYSVWNLMASYEVDKHLTVAANLYNVLNRKYLTSVYWDQSYYAAPVNASVSVKWKY